MLTDANEYVGGDASDVSVLYILLALAGLALVMGGCTLLVFWLLRRYCGWTCFSCNTTEEELVDSEEPLEDPKNSRENSQSHAVKDYDPALPWTFQIGAITTPKPNRTIAASSGTGTNVAP